MAIVYGTTITCPTIVGTHSGFVAQIKTGDLPALMLNGANQIDNGGGNLQVYTDDSLTTRLGVDIVECVTGGTPSFLAYVRMPSGATGQTLYLGSDDTQTAQPLPSALYGSEEVWQDWAYYSLFNENTPSDRSGNQTTGVLGSPTTTGDSILFNGSNQAVTIADSSTIESKSAFSLFADYDPPPLGTQYMFWKRGSTGGYGFRHEKTASSNNFVFTLFGIADYTWTAVVTDRSKLYVVLDGTSAEFFIDGVSQGSKTISSTRDSNTSQALIAARQTSSGVTDGYSAQEQWAAGYNTIALDSNYISTEYDNQSSTTWFSNDGWNAVGGGGFTLDIDGGIYTSTGSSVDLLHNRTLSVDGGVYGSTGANINLLFNRSLSVGGGVYNSTGILLDLLYNRSLSVDGGSFSYIGSAVTLVYNPSTGYVMDIDGGAYSAAGGDVDTLYNRALNVDGGTYSTTGEDLALLYNRSLNIDGGIYSLTGGEINLLLDRVMQVDGGTYSYTGGAVGLIYSGQITLLIDCYSVEFKQDSVTISYAEDNTRLEYGCLQ